LRTENGDEEFPIEEFFWARGAEYADSSGADIISSSLGYSIFDDANFDHPYADRDGNTCLSSIAADLAAKKGIIVSNSAGNSGGSATENKYISCPADGDSVLAVGAIQTDLQIAGFSSWGPNSAGKIKPNVVSIGQGTVLADQNGNAVTGNGTSYSNPNIAGLVACLWQAFPEFNNMQIIDAVERSADRYNNPDERFGYGIPNFKNAYQALLQQRNQKNFDAILGNEWVKTFPNPFSSILNVFFRARLTGSVSISLLDVKGSLIEKTQLQVTEGQKVQFQFLRSATLPNGMYIVHYSDGESNLSMKVIRL
jgi:serine protease AprX